MPELSVDTKELFEAAVLCSSKTMYPDWLSLSGEGYVASIYKKYGEIISPMGCRAFLSPWYRRGGMHPADENDTPVFVGRFNIGAISLHLPLIYAKAKQESKPFFDVLDYYLNLIRKLHLRTYDYLGEMKASVNPLAYCEGGFYGGHLGLHDKIKPILKSATASFGITALNELEQLAHKKSLVEDGSFALKTMEHINQMVEKFKEEDGRLYAIYGTPAENLCGLQVQQFRKKHGVIENVSDRDYVSNSFHCHVSEEISPIEKQDKEKRFWDLCNGGKIQYVKYPIDYNMQAFKTLLKRAMRLGFYEGVNLSLSYCDDCGHEELNMDVCPKCGSNKVTFGVFDRIELIKDKETTKSPSNRPPYIYQIPLSFIPGVGGKTIEKLLDSFETEMNILHKLSEDDIESVVGEKVAKNIVNAREGNIKVESGGGGNYGKVTTS